MYPAVSCFAGIETTPPFLLDTGNCSSKLVRLNSFPGGRGAASADDRVKSVAANGTDDILAMDDYTWGDSSWQRRTKQGRVDQFVVQVCSTVACVAFYRILKLQLMKFEEEDEAIEI